MAAEVTVSVQSNNGSNREGSKLAVFASVDEISWREIVAIRNRCNPRATTQIHFCPPDTIRANDLSAFY